MRDLAVRVQHLSKQFTIGAKQERYRTLRDTLTDAALSPARKVKSLFERNGHARKKDEIFWALRDVSFDVKQGEVVGIIGRNGAGKSTLLKILSRITEPTSGFAEIHGRVGSLLEVGTGFHPELSGRENIFLNGAILGMGRNEIEKKFDEIVAFAEVEKFIDTPVKHYSSGMYLRLAFAVAAHLYPEILLVDEVLAVGDAAFQAKCLEKMSEVAERGRTVIFVSHNMAAVRSLCDRLIVLKEGSTDFDGSPEEGFGRYFRREDTSSNDLTSVRERRGDGRIRLTFVEVSDASGCAVETLQSGQALLIDLSYEAKVDDPPRNLVFHIFWHTLLGERLFALSNRFARISEVTFPKTGKVRCIVSSLPLNQGQYSLDFVCKTGNQILDHVYAGKIVNVVEGDFFGTGKLPPPSSGNILVSQEWIIS